MHDQNCEGNQTLQHEERAEYILHCMSGVIKQK